MLHKNEFIIAPQTLTLIQEIQGFAELNDFSLVGGTALALQIGHRNSIDIDLFCTAAFDTAAIIRLLSSRYTVKEIFRRENTLISLVNNIKTDFIRHDYPLLQPPIATEGIRMLGLPDITAMKVHAIIQSGKRLKDFIDIYYLLERFSMEQVLGFFTAKYTYSNEMVALKALTYFEDIDESIDPPITLHPLPLKTIKARIIKAAVQRNMVF
jgi:Nucleotidyl transferase AbiEii toxin, Type IV TA system